MMTINEAKALVEKKHKDLKVVSGTSFKNLYVFTVRNKDGSVPIITGPPCVDKNTGEIKVFGPVSDIDDTGFDEAYKTDTVHFSKDAFAKMSEMF